MYYWLKDQTLSKGLDVGHIQIQTTFYRIRVKKMLTFLASSTFFKYAQPLKNSKFSCPQTPLTCSDRFAILTGNTWAPTYIYTWATRFLDLGAQRATAYKS